MSQEVISVIIQNPEQPIKAILVPGTEVVGFAELTNVGPDGLSGYSGFSGSGYSGFSGIGTSGYSGFCGLSGYSGFSSASGFSGFSGLSGFSGFSGKSGYSGFSGSGVSGYSGFCGDTGATGSTGASGFSGFCGLSGYSGFCGLSGYSGFSGSGVSGYSGFSGIGTSGFSGYSSTSGYSGFSSTSGYSGFCGLSGYSGFCGLSGYSGFSGVGTSGFSGYSGAGLSGFSGFCGLSGYSGFSGKSGYSGFSGGTGADGASGFSGFCGAGVSGFSGFSGPSGYSGFSSVSGYSGLSGYSGFCGLSGYSGFCGTGTSGFSGYSGFSGKSGYSGFCGLSGYSGSAATVFTVTVAANTNQAITSNLPTIDDISTSENDRVLLTQQNTDSENGVWVVHAASAWTRPSDFANGALIPVGTLVHVTSGTQYANVYFSLIGGIGDVTTFTVGTSSITSEGLVDPYSWDRNAAGHTLATGGVMIPNGLDTNSPPSGTALQGEVKSDKMRVGPALTDQGTGTVNVSGGYYVNNVLLAAVSGFSGYSGFSGKSGYSGFCGLSGFSGFSGTGTSGFSGFSSTSGYSGFSSTSGFSGFSGVGDTIRSARVYNSGNQSISSGSETVLTFDTENYDTDSIHSTSSNTGRLTATTAGYYIIQGECQLDASALGTERRLRIRLNGTTFIAQESQLAFLAGTASKLGIQTVWNMAATDYVELMALQDSAGALNAVGGQDTTWFSMTRQADLGVSGYSGFSGKSGYSGFCGLSGYSGFCGLSGYSGFCGLSGYSGFSAALTTGAGLTADTAVNNQQTPTTGGVTLASQTLAAGSMWVIRAFGDYTAVNSATARNLELQPNWGGTNLTKIAIVVKTSVALSTTSWSCDLLITGTSTTAAWVSGAASGTVTQSIAGTSTTATSASNTSLPSGAQTLDFRVDTSASVVGDIITVKGVAMMRIK